MGRGGSHSNARSDQAAVSALLALALLDAAEAQGARRQSVQASAGCELSDWIDVGSFARLIDAAVVQTGDPAFGLRWGQRAPLSNFGIVASLALWSPSPRAALSAVMRFQGLLFQGRPVASLQVHGAVASIRCELTLPLQSAQRSWSEFVAVGALGLLQQLCGRADAIARISFQHAAPAYEHEYRRSLGDSYAFNCSSWGLDVDAALLDRERPQYNQRLGEAVLFEASCALARLGGRQRCSARVREALASSWPNLPSMDDMARRLGMSSRTLRRHLEQEGTAFPALVAESLRNRAVRLLGDPHSSIKEVAYALGFATPSAFHRAFKRWTGSSPSEIRASGAPDTRALHRSP